MKGRIAAALLIFAMCANLCGCRAVGAINAFFDLSGPDFEFIEDYSDGYGYLSLSREEQQVYQQMNAAAAVMGGKTAVTPVSKEAALRVEECILEDNPEYFWIDGVTLYSNVTGKISAVEFMYNVSLAEKNDKQRELDAAVEEFAASVSAEDDYGKALAVHDFLVTSVVYDETASDNQNAYSALVNRRSVCAGYARAAQLLLERLGIFSLYVKGSVDGGAHAWNIVRLDGDYYWLDVTLDDPAFNDIQPPEGYVRYDFFCITDLQLGESHVVEDMPFDLPACTASDCNYFVHEGLLYYDYDETVKSAMVANIWRMRMAGKNYINIRYLTRDGVDKTVAALQGSDDFWQFISKYNHTLDDTMTCSRIFYITFDDTPSIAVIFE